MNTMVKVAIESMPPDFFKEWGRNVEQNHEDATAIANLFMVLMQDTANEKLRQACACLVVVIRTRHWEDAFDLIKEYVDHETRKSMENPKANEFYNRFKGLILTHVQDYFSQFMEAHKDDKPLSSEEVMEINDRHALAATPGSDAIGSNALLDAVKNGVIEALREEGGEGWKNES